jgi:hypothetical protein
MADELKELTVRVARLETIVHEIRSITRSPDPLGIAGDPEKPPEKPPALAPAPPAGSKGGPR